MGSKNVLKEVEDIIAKASDRAEAAIKAAVRRRMTQNPRPGGFIFAMGSVLWFDSAGRMVEPGVDPGFARTDSIDAACEEFLDAFGSMTWRIDYVNGRLVERTNW